MSFIELPLLSFTEALSSGAPVPGGGGAAALVGAVGTSLASMVANLTTGKKKYALYEADIQSILEKTAALRLRLLSLIEEDARYFEPLSRAYGLPKDEPHRDEIMEAALREACTAPLAIMKALAEAIGLHAALAKKGSRLAISDVGAGVIFCKSALMGASLNILINVRMMKDQSYAKALQRETEDLIETAGALADRTYAEVLSLIC
jgi:formiminotetrahydrofolate cyclodeaminase